MTGFFSKIAAVVTALTLLGTAPDAAVSSMKSLVPQSEQTSDTTFVNSEQLTAPVDPVALCKSITIGWNLGNSLDATGYGENSETSWGNPKTTKELIDKVRDSGFDAVRIPTTWFNHADDDLNVDSAWFERVHEVVDYAYNEGMYVILNVHHENWNDPYENTYKETSRKLKNLWKQIAKEFKDYGSRLIFEGMNEPRWRNTNYEWNGGNDEGRSVVNKLNADFVKAVRATGGNNRYRALMIPTYAASASALEGFTVPDDDSLIVSIHAYSPYNFAMNENGTTLFDPTDSNSTAELIWLSDTLYDRFISKGVGAVIGECGTVNKKNPASRIAWAKYFPVVFGDNGIPIFLWDNNAYGIGNETFGQLHRNTLTWENPEYIEALVNAAKSCK